MKNLMLQRGWFFLLFLGLAACATPPFLTTDSIKQKTLPKPEEGLVRLNPLEQTPQTDPLPQFFSELDKPYSKKLDENIPSIDTLLALEREKALREQIAQRPEKSKRDGRLKIALLSPRSRLSQISESFMFAAELALFNAGRDEIDLLFFDSGQFPEDAAKAAKKAVDAQADVILGPLFADSVVAASSIARRAGIPMISFSNSGHLSNPGIYIFGPEPDQQIEHIVDFALSRNARNVALFVPSNDYGRIITESVRKNLEQNNRSLNYLGYYNPENIDPSNQVRQLVDFDQRRILADQKKKRLQSSFEHLQTSENSELINAESLQASEDLQKKLKLLEKRDTVGAPPFDTLIVGATNSQALRTVFSLFSYFDAGSDHVTFYGLQNWDSFRGLGNESSLRGAYYPTLKTKNFNNFIKDIRSISNKNPGNLAALVYDATVVAITASDGDLLSFGALEQNKGFGGITGRFRFHSNGKVERLYAVAQITASGTKEIVAASSFFASPSLP